MSAPNAVDLSVFVEFGVGLAGFSGVVVAFGQRGTGRLGEYDRFRVIQLLLASLTPAFLGLLPEILAGFGVRDEDAPRIVGALVMAAIGASILVAFVTARGMSPRARAHLSRAVWWIAMVPNAVLFVWNGLNLLGWPRPTEFGPAVLGMTWFLVVASLMFFRLLLVRLGGEDAA
jgi:hypothetical protein